MSAISKYDQLLFPGGALPAEIFSDEPGGDSQIPTRVDYRDGRGVSETYNQELDPRGRLLCISLGSSLRELVSRSWTGDRTYTDTISGGGVRRVEDGSDGQLIVMGPNGGMTELWETPAEEPGDFSYRHAKEFDHAEHFPETHAAEYGPDGKLIQEREWLTAAYEEDMPPQSYQRWEYNETGTLVTVASHHTAPEGIQRPYYTEEFRWVGDKTLKIVGTYANIVGGPLVGREQTREYDPNGRVERITGSISVPSSAMNTYEMELRYE